MKRKVIAMYDTGSTAFMLICTMLVLLMTPGLAFFYGGLSRRKNVVNTMMMVMSVIGIVGVMWVVCGWSFAYGGDGSIPVFGGFDQLGCLAATNDMLVQTADVPEGAIYPAIINICFQMAFCMITCAIITGAVAGRMKFGAVVLFIALWIPLVYAPLAHMVWGGEGSGFSFDPAAIQLIVVAWTKRTASFLPPPMTSKPWRQPNTCAERTFRSLSMTKNAP